jgi:hypothetical protein
VNISISFDNFGSYYSNEVLGISVALLALLMTFIAVSIPTMILATAGFQMSFFDVVINPECRKTIKNDALKCEIKELSDRILENSLFMNLIYRTTWWGTILAIVLVLSGIIIIIPLLSIQKIYFKLNTPQLAAAGMVRKPT